MPSVPHNPAPNASHWRQAQALWQAWLRETQITPARFQQHAWRAQKDGKSGLIIAPTGSGKTLAAIGGALIESLALQLAKPDSPQKGVRVLWVTPLRALANDTTESLLTPLQALLPTWTMAMRTADATQKDKAAILKGSAQLLVTTPESLALLLSSEAGTAIFSALRTVVVDEWHELLPSKRGVLLQLNLARLRHLTPELRVWGLSATLGNPNQALQVLVRGAQAEHAVLIQDHRKKPFSLRSLIPAESVRLPWSGHLGLANLGEVLNLILGSQTTLVFTNTRAQAELWFKALSSIWPLDLQALAIHHGAIDPATRHQVENALRAQTVRCVIATSSLDLGVDFPSVDLVIQIGGAHSVSRMVQRAGRAKHRPGKPIEITAVATQALELCEFAATRDLAQGSEFDNRRPLEFCMDVLCQHTMSMALAGGFNAEALLEEIRSTAAYERLTLEQWQDVLNFLLRGGQALDAYPQYRRLIQHEDGRYHPADAKVTRRHRLAIGTITSQTMVHVQYVRGARLGQVEEAFISKLSPGDTFNFAGRSLELFRIENFTAWVKRSSKVGSQTPAWTGGSLPFSVNLGERMKVYLAQGLDESEGAQPPEMRYLKPLLELQARRSRVPTSEELLIEVLPAQRRTPRQIQEPPSGNPWFIYPFAGRALHEGLALLLSHRLARQQKNTFSWTCNHMGLMVMPSRSIDAQAVDWPLLLSDEHLSEDLSAAVNFSEMVRRRFREIAQIAGLINSRIPGMNFNQRQLQVSAGLLFDVLTKYDPDHLLLHAARSEALAIDLQLQDLKLLLNNLSRQTPVLTRPAKHTPFSFSLWAESARGQFSNESWAERVRRYAIAMEKG